MVEVGSEIRIISDNENYEPYLDRTWIVESIAFCVKDHPGYDTAVGGPLIDCVDLPFSLYKYEFEEV